MRTLHRKTSPSIKKNSEKLLPKSQNAWPSKLYEESSWDFEGIIAIIELLSKSVSSSRSGESVRIVRRFKCNRHGHEAKNYRSKPFRSKEVNKQGHTSKCCNSDKRSEVKFKKCYNCGENAHICQEVLKE